MDELHSAGKAGLRKVVGAVGIGITGGLHDVAGVRTENEWRSVDCPAIVQMFVNKQKGFARYVLEAASHEEAVGSLMTLQWA